MKILQRSLGLLCLAVPAMASAQFSLISSNFNGTSMAAGNYIWFNSVFNISGLGASPVNIFMQDAVIRFSANSTNYNLAVPDAHIVFNPIQSPATTGFTTRWETATQSSGLSGNTYLNGLSYLVPAGGLPGGINPVTFEGNFYTDTAGVSINWQWAAAVYTTFSTNYNALGVKPIDDNSGSGGRKARIVHRQQTFHNVLQPGATWERPRLACGS